MSVTQKSRSPNGQKAHKAHHITNTAAPEIPGREAADEQNHSHDSQNNIKLVLLHCSVLQRRFYFRRFRGPRL